MSRQPPTPPVTTAAPNDDDIPTTALFQEYVSTGSDEAAHRLYCRYAQKLVVKAKWHMSERTRQKLDPDDVVQSVFKSLFVAANEGRITIAAPGSLWAQLGQRVFNKVREKVRGLRVRVPDKLQSLEHQDAELLSREPTPDEAAALVETIEVLKNHFDARDRRIIEQLLSGVPTAEIARETGLTAQRIRQIREKARKYLQEPPLSRPAMN
jgi:RNA polymerase sigma factor (sigma-70 family)